MRAWLETTLIVVFSMALGAQSVYAASLLPLDTERAEALPHGHAEAALGVAYADDMRFPLFTPEGAIASQDLFSLPRIALNVGLGGWAEVQASFEMLYLDEDLVGAGSDSTYGAGDARLFTKLYLLADRSWYPAAGVRFGAKLPNASVEDRLGTDETDFHIDALASKDFGFASGHLNLGLALLGNPGPTAPTSQPFDSDGQDDLFTWSVAVASSPIAIFADSALTLLAEAVGQEGSRFDNDRAAVRGGVQLGFGALRLYAGVSAGMVTASENVGVGAGIIYGFAPGKWFGDE
jgi:hypothetical protein